MQEKMLVVSEADITSRCRMVNKPGQYMIFPRANRVEHQLPGFKGIDAQVLATPQLGAKFVQHELLVHPSGGTSRPQDENLEQFLFVLEGGVELTIDGKAHHMSEGGYCWLPPHLAYEFVNEGDDVSRVVWIRRRYEEIEAVSVPQAIVANEKDVHADPVDTIQPFSCINLRSEAGGMPGKLMLNI